MTWADASGAENTDLAERLQKETSLRAALRHILRHLQDGKMYSVEFCRRREGEGGHSTRQREHGAQTLLHELRANKSRRIVRQHVV